MGIFIYQVIDKKGKNKKGKIDAPSLKQATSKLQAQEFYIVSISGSKERSLKENTPKFLKKRSIPPNLITLFTRQLTILVSTGIPYDKAFEILIEESDHPNFQQIISEMKALIVEGSSLASALESQPELFSTMYISMVRAGEAGGTLGRVLNQLADYREEQSILKSKIQNALIYPIIMTILGFVIVIFMITFILPKITPIFQQFDLELPLPTRIVILASDFMLNYWWEIIIIIVLFVYSSAKFKKTNKGALLYDRLLLQIPVLKNVIKKIIVYRFTQTLGTMLESGVELKHSLDIIRHVMGNRVYDDQFDQITQDITQKGLDLSQALRKSALFPPTVIQMIRVGEESSKLEVMLSRISVIQEQEVKQTIEKTISLMEPVLILWMAIMVGFIVLAVMLPMFEMNQLV